ncbi:MAG: DUF3703 domain-containing protein [Burkholderiales bacterium]|nr:DUF3703 domain-containing protein [Burkholderiales bacterium]
MGGAGHGAAPARSPAHAAGRLGSERRTREARQLLRLALTPLGTLTGRLPAGNTGTTRVGMFVVMPVEAERARLMEDDR